MQMAYYWFVLAFILLMVEMFTGTFYFLAASLAMALGGVAAQLGLALPVQFAVAAVATVAGVLAMRQIKKGRGVPPDLSLDIGQSVKVLAWHDDGSARVHYRGAEWDAETADTDTPRQETLYIQSVQGNKLILTRHKPQRN